MDVSGVPEGFPLSYKSLITFTRDGGITQTAWIPGLGSIVSEVIGVNPYIGHGEWVRTGNREFALTALIPGFNPNGTFLLLAKARASVTLDGTGQQATGTFRCEVFNADGALILGGVGGTYRQRA